MELLHEDEDNHDTGPHAGVTWHEALPEAQEAFVLHAGDEGKNAWSDSGCMVGMDGRRSRCGRGTRAGGRRLWCALATLVMIADEHSCTAIHTASLPKTELG